MSKLSDDKEQDEVLRRALQMKPQKHGSMIDKPPKKNAAKRKPKGKESD